MARPHIAPAASLQPVELHRYNIRNWARMEVGKRTMASVAFEQEVEAEVDRRVREYESMGCVIVD